MKFDHPTTLQPRSVSSSDVDIVGKSPRSARNLQPSSKDPFARVLGDLRPVVVLIHSLAQEAPAEADLVYRSL